MNDNFVEKISDFILGKKCPLASTTAIRTELSEYTYLDFEALVKLLTEYPLSEIERQMLLH